MDRTDAVVPKDDIYISPELLNAIKRSLRDDLVQLCQQACQQSMETKSTQPSPSSSSSNSPTPPQPPKKCVCNHNDEKQWLWLTKAARKHLSQQPPTNYSDDDGLQGGDEDGEEGDSDPFSSEED